MARKKELGDNYTTTIKLLKDNEDDIAKLDDNSVSLSEFTRSALADDEVRTKTIELAKENKDARKKLLKEGTED